MKKWPAIETGIKDHVETALDVNNTSCDFRERRQADEMYMKKLLLETVFSIGYERVTFLIAPVLVDDLGHAKISYE